VNITTLQEAQCRLGKEVFIALDPKGDWGFDSVTGVIRRLDGRFHQGVVKKHPGGWHLLVLDEEPGLAPGKPVGQVVVVYDKSSGNVLARRAMGLNGEVLELCPSSVSKGETVAERSGPLIQFNPQRIEGEVEVVMAEDSRGNQKGVWMPAHQFVKMSPDGRSLAALAKSGLLYK